MFDASLLQTHAQNVGHVRPGTLFWNVRKLQSFGSCECGSLRDGRMQFGQEHWNMLEARACDHIGEVKSLTV